jgi:RNA polymerase-binding transcription factor DksA
MVNNNPNKTGTTRDIQLEQELGGLRQEYEQLREKRVRTEQDIAHLTDQLEALKAQALAEYGTSDPDELQALLEEKRQENERIVASYREHVQQIQADLDAVEKGSGVEREG